MRGTLHLIPDPQQPVASQVLAAETGAVFEYNDFYEPALLEDDAALAERIALWKSLPRDRSRDSLHGVFYDITVHSDDPQIRRISERRVYQSMACADALGVRGVIFHTGTIPNFKSDYYERVWTERNMAFWQQVLEAFPRQEIWIENMFDQHYDLLLTLAQNLTDHPRFGICMDYAHASVFGGDPKAWFSALAPYIRHMHINDNDGTADLHWAVGSGAIDWKAFDEGIRAAGIAPSVLIEMKSLERQLESIDYMRMNQIYPF